MGEGKSHGKRAIDVITSILVSVMLIGIGWVIRDLNDIKKDFNSHCIAQASESSTVTATNAQQTRDIESTNKTVEKLAATVQKLYVAVVTTRGNPKLPVRDLPEGFQD